MKLSYASVRLRSMLSSLKPGEFIASNIITNYPSRAAKLASQSVTEMYTVQSSILISVAHPA